MEDQTLAVGSLNALFEVTRPGAAMALDADADVVVVPTASVFTGAPEAAWAVAQVLAPLDVRVEALMVADRASADEPYFVQRLGEADLVVLCDGSALHARSVWRASPVGAAIASARRVVAIGSVATVVGDPMIDPRGGAPTTGLGYCNGLVVTTSADDEQLDRTRSLLGPLDTLCVLGDDDAILHDARGWRVVRGAPVVTRGHDVVEL